MSAESKRGGAARANVDAGLAYSHATPLLTRLWKGNFAIRVSEYFDFVKSNSILGISLCA